MARGFESKDVEFQQAEAVRGASPRRTWTPEEREARAQRETLELSLARARSDLAAARSAAHRRMLEGAIAALENKLEDHSRERPVLDTRERNGASASGVGRDKPRQRPVLDTRERNGASASGVGRDKPRRRPVLDTRERNGASASGGGRDKPRQRPVLDTRERNGASASGVGVGPHAIKR
jgi:hypothetical protein